MSNSSNDSLITGPKRLPWPLSISSGLLMGGADAIPGVSGGTIALILGIYDRFIQSLNDVLRLPWALVHQEDRQRVLQALRFLVPLGIGVLIAYYLATKLLIGKTENPGLMLRPETAPACYAFFFGLVLFSLREPWRRIRGIGLSHYGAFVVGCALAAILSGLPHSSATPATWTLLLGGAGAISVMLLPGVSGSLLLVILGQYQVIVGAVHDRELGILVVFLAGLALGAIAFIPTLRFVLARQHDLTMAALTGLMAGSLRALWPWKTNYDLKAAEMANTAIGDNLPLVLGAGTCGALVVFLLALLEKRIERAEHPAMGSQGR